MLLRVFNLNSKARGWRHAIAVPLPPVKNVLYNTSFRHLSLLDGSGGGDDSNEAHTWLTQTEGVSSEVADEIIQVFTQAGGSVSSSGLKQLGDRGLQQLVQSVERELEKKATRKHQLQSQEKLSLYINNPRISKDMKRISIYPNETLYNTTCTPIIDDLEFACGGNAACSTCHVIVDPESYHKLSPPEEDELDMLDLAWEPTSTSRLACQMVVTKECDNGMIITVPTESNNLF